MKKMIFIVVLYFSILCLNSAPAYRGIFTEVLPNESSIEYYVRGDEFLRYFISTDGYTLIKNDSGYYVYAQLDSNEYLIKSTVLANKEELRTDEEKNFLNTISPFLTYHPNQLMRNKETSLSPKTIVSSDIQKAKSSVPSPLNMGAPSQLIVLVNFSDKSFVVQSPQFTFSSLLNEQGYSDYGATGSARDYFIQSSYGAYAPVFDVVGPFTLSQNMAYYGANNSSGDDIRAKEMIIEACGIADQDGVDFSIYDNDNDGYIDNVYVIYAGNNEAENPAQTNLIWPHSWDMENNNTSFDGKILFKYACSSELRGSGTTVQNICSIGTFCHEYSHLLGLPDLYHTSNSLVFCVDNWSVMDNGLYNNLGRTPPVFSSYERFFVGWLTPEILSSPISKTLPYLNESNKAFIIAETTPNLIGNNPTPKEFFLLENRQQKGFDSYIPYHGMLAWHIDFDQDAWDNNIPNNSISNNSLSHQRIYIQPADGTHTIQTKTGDPFPGTSNVSSFSPSLWSGQLLNKPISNIAEVNEVVVFDFMGGAFDAQTAIIATNATDVNDSGFVANWIPTYQTDSYCLDLYIDTQIQSPFFSKIDEEFSDLQVGVNSQIIDFEANGLQGWSGNNIYHGSDSEPGVPISTQKLRLGSALSAGNLITPTIDLSSNDGWAVLEFDVRIWNSSSEKNTINVQHAPDGVNFSTIATLSAEKLYFTNKQVQISDGTNLSKIRFSPTASTYNRFFVDNIKVYQGEKSGYYIHSELIETFCDIQTNTFPIQDLLPSTHYSYTVKATDGDLFSPVSNRVLVTTNFGTGVSKKTETYKVWTENKNLYVSGFSQAAAIEIIQMDGKIVDKRATTESVEQFILPRSGVFLLKITSNHVSEVLKVVVY